MTGGGDKTDWKRVRSMKDEDIIYDDDSPIGFLLDSDVIEWYKKQNIAYQPLVNELLCYYVEAHH